MIGIDKRTLIVTGTPTVPGSYSFTILATAGGGAFLSKTFTIGVMTITNASPLPAATISAPYSAQLLGAGGTAPYTFVVSFGALPTGLTMDAAGLISGTPTVVGTSTFTADIKDAMGRHCDKNFSLQIGSSCPDWTQLIWGFSFGGAFLATIGDGTATFTPNLGGSDTFTTSVSGTHPPFGDGGAAENDATIPYSGSGCNCNLHLDVTYLGDPGQIFAHVQIDIIGGGLLLNAIINASGSFDFPFVLPDSSIIPIVLHVTVFNQMNGNFPDSPESMLFTGTITNVP